MLESQLKICNINKSFISSNDKTLKQVLFDVNFDLFAGETLGIVGESGCGKSTLARVLTQLDQDYQGRVVYNDKEIQILNYHSLIPIKKDIQLIFQDPYSSLNPRLSILNILDEPLKIHYQILSQKERYQKCKEICDLVGFSENVLSKYPHEFSGGQRQRLVIARALIIKPKIIIADEPVSALDVSIQSQILNLLKDLKEEFNLSMIFISHDLSVVSYMSDRLIVMYNGKIVEYGNSSEIFNNPQHEYTKTLIESVPKIIHRN